MINPLKIDTVIRQRIFLYQVKLTFRKGHKLQ